MFIDMEKLKWKKFKFYNSTHKVPQGQGNKYHCFHSKSVKTFLVEILYSTMDNSVTLWLSLSIPFHHTYTNIQSTPLKELRPVLPYNNHEPHTANYI